MHTGFSTAILMGIGVLCNFEINLECKRGFEAYLAIGILIILIIERKKSKMFRVFAF